MIFKCSRDVLLLLLIAKILANPLLTVHGQKYILRELMQNHPYRTWVKTVCYFAKGKYVYANVGK
jgi:hypothetical protein